MKRLPRSVPERQNALPKVAVRFEEKIYAAATSQVQYSYIIPFPGEARAFGQRIE
jgi:hypothetical protein